MMKAKQALLEAKYIYENYYDAGAPVVIAPILSE